MTSSGKRSGGWLAGGVMQDGEEVVAGKGEESVAIQDAGLGLGKRVGAEAVFVDFDHQLAVAAEGSKRARRQARAHGSIPSWSRSDGKCSCEHYHAFRSRRT